MPTAKNSRNFKSASLPIDAKNMRTKFEVRSFTVPEIIGGIQKIGQSMDTPTLPFLHNFNGYLFVWTP